MAPHAPHWTKEELDFAQRNVKTYSKEDIFKMLKKERKKKHIGCPKTVKTLRLFLNGKTYKRGAKETRGRKRLLTKKHLVKVDTVRKALYKKADGEVEYHWKDIIKKARVPKASPETVGRNLREFGFQVRARVPRKKVQRPKDVKKVRVKICKPMSRKPVGHFTGDTDTGIKGYWDNKRFKVPTSAAAMANLKRSKVRFHLRKPGEGLKPGFTKPDATKHRRNPGGQAHVFCAIINNRVAVWEYRFLGW